MAPDSRSLAQTHGQATENTGGSPTYCLALAVAKASYGVRVEYEWAEREGLGRARRNSTSSQLLAMWHSSQHLPEGPQTPISWARLMSRLHFVVCFSNFLEACSPWGLACISRKGRTEPQLEN